jgi:hypothetical protein
MMRWVDVPSLRSCAPAKRPWLDSTRPMPASRGQLRPQPGSEAATRAAALLYASSATTGIPLPASPETRPAADAGADLDPRPSSADCCVTDRRTSAATPSGGSAGSPTAEVGSRSSGTGSDEAVGPGACAPDVPGLAECASATAERDGCEVSATAPQRASTGTVAAIRTCIWRPACPGRYGRGIRGIRKPDSRMCGLAPLPRDPKSIALSDPMRRS